MQNEQGNRFKRRTVAMDELKQKQKAKIFRRRVTYVVLFLSLTVLFTAICFVVFFKIKTVEIEGESRYSNEQIIEALSVEYGDNLYSFSATEAEAELSLNLPYLNKVIIERDLPSTLIIHVEEKKPDMYVEINGQKYLLTDDMQILEYTDEPSKLYGLLMLRMDAETVGRCIVGEKLVFADERTGDVISQAYADISAAGATARVNYIDANNRFGIYIGLDGKYDVYMGDINEFDTKLSFAVGIADKLLTVAEDNTGGDIDVSEINEGVYTPKR